MVKLHATRLMRGGEVALWHEGRIVWSGNVGAVVRGVTFDTVSMHVEDAVRISNGSAAVSQAQVLQKLAD